MAKPFFTKGRRKLFGQMSMNVCQYLIIAAIASELLKIPVIQRLIIVLAAAVFALLGLRAWPREEGD